MNCGIMGRLDDLATIDKKFDAAVSTACGMLNLFENSGVFAITSGVSKDAATKDIARIEGKIRGNQDAYKTEGHFIMLFEDDGVKGRNVRGSDVS